MAEISIPELSTLYISRPHGSDKFKGAQAFLNEHGVLEVRRLIRFGPAQSKSPQRIQGTWELVAAFKEWNYWKYLEPKATTDG